MTRDKREDLLYWSYLGELTEDNRVNLEKINKMKDKVLRMSPFVYNLHLSEIGVSHIERQGIIKKRFGVDLYD
jgi:hypothetical protein